MMHIPYLIAAALAFVLGLAHSYLGERYILIRLFRRTDIPKLFGGTAFTTQTLRFAWHLTTIALWGFAAIFYRMADGALTTAAMAAVLAGVFLASAAIAFVVSRGRHLAWLVLLAIGGIAWYGAGH